MSQTAATTMTVSQSATPVRCTVGGGAAPPPDDQSARSTVLPKETDAQDGDGAAKGAEASTPGEALPSARPCRGEQDGHGERHGPCQPRRHYRRLGAISREASVAAARPAQVGAGAGPVGRA